MLMTQRTLIIAGFLMVLIGFSYGFGCQILLDDHTRLRHQDSFEPAFTLLALQSQLPNEPDPSHHRLDELIEDSGTSRRAVGAHAHAVNVGYVLVLLGLISPFCLSGFASRLVIARVLAVGSYCYPVGLAINATGLSILGEGLAALGSGILILGSGMFLYGSARRSLVQPAG